MPQTDEGDYCLRRGLWVRWFDPEHDHEEFQFEDEDDTSPPERGTDKYNEILKGGCGGSVSYTLEGPEYDCDHGYPWTCDDCPIVNEKAFEKWLQGEDERRRAQRNWLFGETQDHPDGRDGPVDLPTLYQEVPCTALRLLQDETLR